MQEEITDSYEVFCSYELIWVDDAVHTFCNELTLIPEISHSVYILCHSVFGPPNKYGKYVNFSAGFCCFWASIVTGLSKVVRVDWLGILANYKEDYNASLFRVVYVHGFG